jgi:hypothetical protein
MPRLDEQMVSASLSEYFRSCGLSPLGKRSPFTHDDDAQERSFQVDLAIGPNGTPGNRTTQQEDEDKMLFLKASKLIDPVIEDLRHSSLFPEHHDSINSWCREANPNPVYGIAVEIENCLSKYFLGSLLAASIAGRWGILVAPDCVETQRWIKTVHRMMHKGAQSPIPSNILIFSWSTLQRKIGVCHQESTCNPCQPICLDDSTQLQPPPHDRLPSPRVTQKKCN